MAKIEVTKTELIWPGKYNEDGTRKEIPRVSLPFQVIETINTSRATREAEKKRQPTLFDVYQGKEGDTFEEGWRNKLIWGDNLLVMGSLLEKFAGKIDLIYIDPPFDTGSDFSYKIMVGSDDEPLPGKEPSAIEEYAYRDTWGRGYDSYLNMMALRLNILRDLLSDKGSIFVHLDVHTGPYIKIMMDEVFGQDNFQNEIAWYYYNKLHDSRKKLLPKAFDQILYYVKSKGNNYCYHSLKEKRENPIKKLKYHKVDGRIQNIIGEDGKALTYISEERTVDNVWRIRCLQPANKSEWVHFETQKPVDLIERIIEIASDPNDIVLDCFCGSGSALIAAENLGRRWIGCDLGRYAIHVSRKRLLGLEGCNSFEILNLGKYERQYWQGVTFAGKGKGITEQALYEYLAFILKLYGAQPVAGLTHLHGKKGKAMVHIGAVDAPVTIDEINSTIAECVQLKQGELHILGWEWEMGLYDLMVAEAKKQGVKLLLLQIPREVMEQQAVDKGDIKFFELAYLEVEINTKKGARQTLPSTTVSLKDFVIPNTELIPEEVRSKVKKWSDYIDYWAVDWNFQDDTFMQGWVTYRTRKDRTLALTSDPHIYEKSGKYRILVKVVDIFGNDTSQVFEVEVN
jgi:DNA modification methylase